MRDRIFIDTNVFVYAIVNQDKRKQKISRYLISSALNGGNAHVSFQVVQEFINVFIKQIRNVHLSDCKEYLREVLYPLMDVYPNAQLYNRSLSMHERYNFSFYDSLILAAALEAKCNILYSEDLQHGQSVSHLKILNPYI